MQNLTLREQVARLLSVKALAKMTGHTVMSVYRALERLGVQPEVTLPVRLYDPEVAPTLKARMRQPSMPKSDVRR